MLKKELIERSPIRVLEKSIHGGLGKGNLGVFTARKGVGKTACLIHVATDKLLKGENVLHISFADNPKHIEDWYKLVYNEVAKAYRLENAAEIYEELLPLRLLLHFKQKDMPFADVRQHVEQFAENLGFAPRLIMVDGLPFDDANEEYFQAWRDFAREKDCEIWFSATLHRHQLDFDERGVPAPVNRFSDIFSVIIMLIPQNEYVEFKLLKDHENENIEKLRLKLDPKTLLIGNRRV